MRCICVASFVLVLSEAVLVLRPRISIFEHDDPIEIEIDVEPEPDLEDEPYTPERAFRPESC